MEAAQKGKRMKMQTNSRKQFMSLTFVAASFLLGESGCSVMQAIKPSEPTAVATTSAAPPPFVQNCVVVTISSPTRYECDGKTYTSFELEKLRIDWEAKLQGQVTPLPIPTKG